MAQQRASARRPGESRRMTVVVFTGPTLPRAEVETLLGGIILPPARQGDVWRAVRAHRPVAIGLIDGVFFHEPAVWHREILWALAQGVHVFGAASMGALRAAELAPFGMQGVGKVFEAFRDGIWPGFADPFEDDDEVAVVHAPAELGHAPLSDAMVDLRDTLLAASDDGVVTASEARALARQLKALPFGERSVTQIGALAADCLDSASEARLRAWLPNGVVRRKQLDALSLLETLRRFLVEPSEPFTPAFQFEYVQAWHAFVTAPNLLTDEEALVLEEARLCEEDWHDTSRAAFGRLCAVRTGPASRNDDARAALDQFRLKRGLVRRADLDAWLVSNAAATNRLEQMMRDEASVTASLSEASPALDAAIVDYLRLTDRFAPLLRRALAKRGKLGGSRPPVPGPLLDAALSWFSERAGRETLAPEPGMWADEATFHNAVWREYIFVHAEAR
jgi:hypothetical protein